MALIRSNMGDRTYLKGSSFGTDMFHEKQAQAHVCGLRDKNTCTHTQKVVETNGIWRLITAAFLFLKAIFIPLSLSQCLSSCVCVCVCGRMYVCNTRQAGTSSNGAYLKL